MQPQYIFCGPFMCSSGDDDATAPLQVASSACRAKALWGAASRELNPSRFVAGARHGPGDENLKS